MMTLPVRATMTKDGAARDLERFGAVNAEQPEETFKPQAEFRVRRRANGPADSSHWLYSGIQPVDFPNSNET